MENSNRNNRNRSNWDDDYEHRDRNWRNRNFDQNMRDRNDLYNWDRNRGNDENYGRRNWNNDDRYDNYGLGDTSQGSGNYGHRDYESGRHLSHGTGDLGRTFRGRGSYDDSRNNSDEGGYRNRDRNYDDYNNRNQNRERDWWDRTSDEVASWFGDDDAEGRRRMDKIKGPHSGKGPKGYSRSDDKIKDDIHDRLYNDSYVDASDIEVSVSNGEVTLSGTVNDKRTKRHVEDCADAVSGVKDVSNNLKVNQHPATDLWNPKNDRDRIRSGNDQSMDQSNDLLREKSNSKK